MEFLLDFILHIDQYMIDIVQEYHTWAYVILFIIIFCETGLVVTPFLPGDSLLFVAGAFCYAGYFFGDLPFVQKNLKLLIVAIIVVSILPAVIEVGRNKWKTRNY